MSIIKRSLALLITPLLLMPLVMEPLKGTPTLAAEKKTYYISTRGNNSNAGTKNEPLKDIYGFKSKLLQDVKTSTLSSVDVVFEKGTYYFTSSFTLSKSELKNQNIDINFIGAKDSFNHNTVIFSGGTQLNVNDFKYDKTKKYYVYDLSDLDLNFDINTESLFTAPALYYNGTPMILSRYPNNSFLKIGTIAKNTNENTIFNYSATDIPNFNNDKNLFIAGYIGNDWYYSNIPATIKDTQVSINSKLQYGIKQNQRFFILNSLAALDSPNEYYIDYSNKLLYFSPKASLSYDSIELSLLNKPMFIMNDLDDVSFKNIKFTTTRSNALKLNNSKKLNLIANEFTNISNVAILINNSYNCNIENNTIHNIGSSAISMSGGDRANLISSNNTISNNEIFKCSMLKRTFTPSIDVRGVGTTISNNKIYNSPYIGISFSGNNNIISNNELHDLCYEVNDSGAIYSGRSWTYRGNVIKGNYIHHLGNKSSLGNTEFNDLIMGIYMDDCMSSAEISDNVLEKIPVGMLLGGGRDHLIYDNYLYNCTKPIVFDERGMATNFINSASYKTLVDELNSMPYTSTKWLTAYPQLDSIKSVNKQIPYGNRLFNNYLENCGPMKIPNSVIENGLISKERENVDIIAKLSSLYNVTKTNPKYDALYDFNSDGIIDLYDVVFYLKDFK